MASCYMSHSSAAEPRLGSLPQAGTPSSAARGRGVVGVTGHRPVDADLSWLTGRRRQVTIQVGAFRSVTTHPHVVSTVSLTRIEGNLLGWIMAIMAALTARMEEALSFRMMHCMGPFPATDGMEMAEMAECSLFQSMSLPSTVVVVNGHPEITFVRGLSIALCEVRG